MAEYEPRIPTAVILPYYEAWAKCHPGPRMKLSELLRCSGRTVKNMLGSEELTFSQADALLTAIGYMDVWHVELARYYEDAA